MSQPKLHSVLVAGATGAVGRHCVNLLVRDPRVGSVVALVRSQPKEPEFYGLEEKSDVYDVSKLQHLKVDFNEDLDKQFKDEQFTAGLSCIGVYSSAAKNEKEFHDKEYVPNLKVANAAAAHGATRWSYLSGAGVKQSEKKACFQALFSWVKGCVERDLKKIAEFEMVNYAHPGYILGRPGPAAYWTDSIGDYFKDSLSKKSFAIHRDDISAAMVSALLDDTLKGEIIYENEDLKRIANKYRASLGADQEK